MASKKPEPITIESLPMGEDLKYARRLTRNEFETICHKYMFKTISEISAAAKNPNVPVIDMMILSVMNRGIQEGDHKCMEFLLDRMIGSVVRKVRVQYEDEQPQSHPPVEINFSEKAEMLKKLTAIYEKKAREEDATIDVEPK